MIEAEVAEHKARFLSEVSQPHHWEKAALDLQHKISSVWGTICFSESDDNLLMWSHYAHGHRGFVLGFDEHHHQFRVARPVEYKPERPVVRQDESSPTEFFLRKAELWNYEREKRVFMELSKCDVKRETDDGPIHLLRIDPSSVVSVILGSKVPKHLQSLAARAIGTKFFPRARLKIAIPHLAEFKVEIHDIGGGKESLFHSPK